MNITCARNIPSVDMLVKCFRTQSFQLEIGSNVFVKIIGNNVMGSKKSLHIVLAIEVRYISNEDTRQITIIPFGLFVHSIDVAHISPFHPHFHSHPPSCLDEDT